jgi:peroxiredoxin
MKKLAILFALLMLVGVAACSKKEQPLPGEGKPAPDFTLKNLAGENVSLASLRGKVVLLNFWATWCPPCREEIPSMVKLNQSMAGKPFQMLAVSIDEGGKQAVEEFFKRVGATLPTLLDTKQEIGARYGITGVPETFLIDPNGVILKKVIGPLDWSHPDVVRFLEQAMSGAAGQK